ncbi:MAG TPA: hypothetical protein VKB58_18355 [Terriglobales bacterium]|nr:hypothetical protein [Terriglobales bacterium]
MRENTLKKRRSVRTLLPLPALLPAIVMAGSVFAQAQHDGDVFSPGNIVVSRSVYDNNPNNVQVGQILPPNCEQTQAGCAGTASNDGTYPTVWNNDLVDSSFGITSKILLDQYTPAGTLVNSLEVPNSSQPGVPPQKDQMVTSFSSKSEMALNLSTDGQYLTFMGYVSPIDNIDVSNSNTPAITDPTNPVGTNYYRAVAQVDAHGKFHFTESNAYSGNNGRAAVLNGAANLLYTAGNAGNGGNPQPDGVIIGAGAQIMTPEIRAEIAQRPGGPAPVASFNVTQIGDQQDKIGKDDNFRGMTVFNNVLYYTKGSGGNGVNTVYFVDPTLTVCNDSNGIGIPPANASLPTAPLAYDPSLLQTMGLDPNNMCILNGFPKKLKSKTSFPFGIWFGDANTLYVADEGDGDNTFSNGVYTTAASSPTAGLQKWVFDSVAGKWNMAYVLQSGLQLGIPYTVANYPTGNNPATGLPWSPGTDGLRNITGINNGDGTVTIYAITSTVSGNGDQGADPNKLVVITDQLSATTLPNESFTTFQSAGFGEVLRGVSFTPGSTTR